MHAEKGELMNGGDALILKDIVDKNLNTYLDELSFLFGMKTNEFVHYHCLAMFGQEVGIFNEDATYGREAAV